MSVFLGTIGAVAVLVLTGFFLYAFIKWRYKVADANQALIVSGRSPFRLGRKQEGVVQEAVKVCVGDGKFVWPGWQQYDFISLEEMMIEIQLSEIYSEDNIPLDVIATAQVKVGDSDDLLLAAAQRFLGVSPEKIKEKLKETIEGHTRSIPATMSALNFYQNQKGVQSTVRELSEDDLGRMGFVIDSFTFKKIDDSRKKEGEQGYFESLGEPEVQDARRKAREATAEADEKATIREEQARLAKENKKLAVDREVLDEEEKFKIREQDVAAKVNRETAKAIKAKELEEAEQDIEIAKRAVDREKKQLEAEVREKADAARYKVEQEAAAARKKREQEAAAEEAEGRAEAAVIEAKGKAQADAELQLGLARAEARKKMVEALLNYDESALRFETIKVLPDLAAAVSEPLSRGAGATVIMGNGNGHAGTGIGKFGEDAVQALAGLFPMAERLLGIDLESALQNVVNGVEGANGQTVRGADDREDADEESVKKTTTVPSLEDGKEAGGRKAASTS